MVVWFFVVVVVTLFQVFSILLSVALMWPFFDNKSAAISAWSSLNVTCIMLKDIWILDSSATNHMTLLSSYLSSYSTLSEKHHVMVVNGPCAPIMTVVL